MTSDDSLDKINDVIIDFLKSDDNVKFDINVMKSNEQLMVFIKKLYDEVE